MKFSTFALALAASSTVSAVRNGFNMGAYKEDGSCMTEGDWEHAFKHMKHLPGKFDVVRVYAASACDTLERAVPAAKKAHVKLLAGIWAEGYYGAEIRALKSAIHKHGLGWMSACSVGSEDLYRNNTSPGKLAKQVHEVKKIIHGHKHGKHIPVGHVDTWTAWVRDHAKVLIDAVDFVGMDGYPYYQNVTIQRSHGTFYKSLAKTKKVAGKKPVWVTETMWPNAGPASGPAIPSVANARHYWKNTMCKLFKTHNTFAYTLKDFWIAPAEPSFGVLNSDNKLIYSLHC